MTGPPITQEDIQKRIAERRAAQQPAAPAGRPDKISDDDILQRVRRRRIKRLIGREPTIEGQIPPIAAPIEAAPPRPAAPEPLEPTARPVISERITPEEARTRRETGMAIGLAPGAVQAQRGFEKRGALPGRREFAAVFGDVMQTVSEALGAPPLDPLGRPITREAVTGPPSVVTPAEATAAGVDPLAGADVGFLQAIQGPQTPAQMAESQGIIEVSNERLIKQNIRNQQDMLARKGIVGRVGWALGAGTIRFGEAIINPLNPDDRTFTKRLETIQTGGGLVAPLDEHRSFLATFGLGLAEMMPTLVALSATGVMGAAGRVTATSRAAIIGALEQKFGRRAATRIFAEALKESAEEGLSVAVFEAVIGRGAGRGVGGRLQVFGEEVTAEAGAFVFGAGLGAGRAIFREIGALRGPISREMMQLGIQNPAQIPAMMDDIATRRGVDVADLWDEFSREVDEGTFRNIIAIARGGGPSGPGRMQDIRAARAEAQAIAAEEARLAPAREFAQQLADDPTTGQATAMRAVIQRFPRLSDEDAAAVVGDAFGRAPTRAEPVDVEGRPEVAPEPTPEAVPEEPKRPKTTPEERADISRKLAALEVTADRRVRELTEGEDVPRSVAGLEDVSDEIDRLINQAAGAAENALVDRAARLSAKVRDAIEAPPQPKAPEKPAEAPAKPEEPEAVAAPERPPEPPEAPAPPPEAPPAEPAPAPERPAPAQVPPERLPPAERLDPEQRAEIEEVFPEAKDLTDEELQGELAGLGIEPRMLTERGPGRRITDLSDDELVARIKAAGQEVPAAGPEFRERLLDVVDPGRQERLTALAEERRELRGRLAEEIRGRREAQREAMTDVRTGLGSQRAFVQAQPRFEADPNVSFVELDIRNLSVANNEVGEELGNQLIVEAGAAVRQAASEAGVSDRQVFRSGGDEFTIIAPNEIAEQIRTRAIELMPETDIPGTEFTSGLRGGVGKTAQEASLAVGAAKKAEGVGRARAPAAKPPAEKPAPTGVPPNNRFDLQEKGVLRRLSQEDTPMSGHPILFRGLWRGSGRAPEAPPATKFGSDPVVGPGRYSSPNRDFAEKFGPELEEVVVVLANPRIITDDVAWRELADQAGLEFPNFSPNTPEQVPRANAAAAALRTYLNAQGNDGLVVIMDRRGDNSKMLEKIFADDTVVEFKPQLEARPVGGVIEEIPEAERVGPKYEELRADPDADLTELMERGDTDVLLVERPGGRTDRLEVEYAIVEADELRQSHNVVGGKSQRNPDFPDEVQTRERFDAEFVQERAAAGVFDEGQLVLKSPTAERGPPIIQDQGVVLGGNNRVAILKEIYRPGVGADPSTRYKSALRESAEEFGLSAAQVDDFTNPVLVRRVTDPPTTVKAARALSDDLNRTAVRARTGAEEAVLASERLSDEALAHFDDTFPTEGTLRAYLNTVEGAQFINRLRDEGTITAEQRNRFFDKQGVLNSEGRDFVENLLLGRAVGSAEAIEQTPAAIRNKLIKAAPTIAGLRGKFAIQPAIQEAVRILGEAQRAGKNVADFLDQLGLGVGEAQFSGPGKQLAFFLSDVPTQKRVVESFRQFRSASRAGPPGQVELLPGAAQSPREAFKDAFGDQFLGEAPPTAAGFAEEVPAAAPVTPAAPARLKLTPEAQARLRERLGVEITPQRQAENLAAFRRRSELRAERRRKRGEAEGARVQPRGAGKRPTKPPAPEREPGPGESGGGRVTGKEPVDVNPPGEPDVARGQRRREKERLEREQKQEARRKALEEERKRLDEARIDADDVSDIRKVRENIRAGLRAAADAANIDPKLVDDQLKDISRIQSNLLDVDVTPDAPRPGFLVGNSPGTGKTFVGAGAIREVVDRAASEGRKARVLVVIPGKAEGPIVNQWRQVARDVFDFEMKPFKAGDTLPDEPGIFTMSATGLGNQFDARRGLKTDFGRFDLVVFDESHLFGNVFGANRAFAARTVRRDIADRSLHLSATPFEFPWDMAYLENLRLWGRGRRHADYEQWLAAHGIRKAKRTKHTYYFVKSNREDVMRTLTQIRREMIEAGVYTQRDIRVDKKLKNDFVEVRMSDVYGSYYNDVMTEIANLEAISTGVDVNLLRSARVTFTRRISELAKIPAAIKLAKQLRDDGRSTVLFTAYKMDFELAPRTRQRFPSLATVVESIDEQMREGLNRMVRELGGEDVVAQVHGGITSAKRRANDIEKFQSGEKTIMIATVDAGGTGLSLHDLTGKHPRAQINLTAPWTGKSAEQLAGRTYRVGSKTDVQMIWMGVDTPVERALLQRVAMKWQAMGALVQGKVDTDASKLAEFDFLPEAELQQQLFGYKKELGIEEPGQISADFAGKVHRIGDFEAESMARLEKARKEFEQLSSVADQTAPSGMVTSGKNPTQAEMSTDLDLPRPNVKILKPSKVIGIAARRFAVRTFLGGIRQFNVKGRFKIVADLVRLRSAQNVRVAAHEFGHHVDKFNFGFIGSPKDIAQGTVPTHLMPFVDELRPLAYAGAKDPVTEGFAEFVADYVMRNSWVRDKAPKFYQYFRDHMNRTNPKDLDTIDWMRQQMDLFRTFPAAERMGSRMIIGDAGELDHFRMMPGERFKKWYTKWLDHQTPFRDMDQIMMLEDPNWRGLQMLARRTFGAEPLAENMMMRGIMDFTDLDKNNKVTRISKGLPEIFKPIDNRGKMDLWRYWAAAMRATELQGRGLETGMEDLIEDGTVGELLKQVQESDLFDSFVTVWQDVQDYQDALLKWLVASQNLTPTQAMAMKKMNEFYVPFHRLMGEPDHLMDWVAQSKAARGQNVDGVVGLPPAIHRFKGDTRPIIDPLESIVGNTRFFTQLGFRKPVENAVAKFSDDVFGAEGHGRFITRIDPKLVASRFSVSQIKQALENLGIRLEDVTDEQLAEIVTLFSPMNKARDLPVFTAVVGGKRQWYQVNDPETWEAMAGMNKKEFGWFVNLAITSKAVLRNGVVMSPEFMVRNFIRDAQTAWIQTPARGRGAAGVARKVPMVAALEGLVESVKAGKLWDEFVASGAAGSALTQISRRSNQEYMKQMFGRKGVSRHLSASHSVPWNVQQVYRGVRDTSLGFMYDIQHASSIFENANRLSTFRASREEGADFLQAGFGARNVSTDFAVHGSRLQAWRLSTAFLNPAAQGTARVARAFKDRPLLTMARSSMLTFSSAALWWHNQQDPDYPEYSANLKSRYWIWRDMSSGTIFRLPKTYIYGDVFGSFLAEAFLDYAFDRDPDIVRRLGIVLQQGFGFTMVPTLLLPAFELALNKSLYFNTPIESQGMREQLPTEFRSRVYTSEASRKLSEALARFAEKADTRGLGRIGRLINNLNLSPVQYDHLIRGYFGTLGFDVWNEVPTLIRLGQNGIRALEGLDPIPFPPNARLRNHLFIRGFTIQFPTGSAESMRRFYDRREVLNDIAVRYSMLQSVDPDRALLFYENHMEEIMTAPLYAMVASRLAVMGRQKANASSAQEIDQLNRDALELARSALTAIGDLTPAEKTLLDQRQRAQQFMRGENRQLQAARDQIELVIMRRQLRGITRPTKEEADQINAIIRAVPGLTGSQRASLRRFYRGIREGSLVDREFGKTPRATQRRIRQEGG